MEKALSPTRADRLLKTFQETALKVRDLGGSRQLIEDEHFSGESMILRGQRLANFGLCSYLGLGEDPRVQEGAHRAIDAYGTSFSSSIAYQALPLYGDLKERFERIFDAAAVIAPTTTLAHFSALPIMVRPGDVAYVDAQVHASVMNGTQVLQSTGIDVHQLHHGDVDALEAVLKDDDGDGRIWYLVDGVYSMHGDTAPAERLMDLLSEYERLHIYCDDAHGFGWSGLHGRGQFLDRAGWHERLVVVVGLAKSFGSMGGVIATRDRELADLIELCGPPLTFGGPIPPPTLGANIASADIHLSDELPELQAELHDRMNLVNQLDDEMSLGLSDTSLTPLWFYEVGRLQATTDLFEAMRDEGFFLNVAAFPAVPHRHAGLRFTVTVKNPIEQIQGMLECLREKSLELFGETQFEVDLTEVKAEPETS
ncbi:MAG: aminotransferase class I/II-fold pyridoxal phosphate-dependent enzyme [Acidimicrobiia bacterium]